MELVWSMWSGKSLRLEWAPEAGAVLFGDGGLRCPWLLTSVTLTL